MTPDDYRRLADELALCDITRTTGTVIIEISARDDLHTEVLAALRSAAVQAEALEKIKSRFLRDELGLEFVFVVVDYAGENIAGVWPNEQIAKDHREVMRRRGFEYVVERHSCGRWGYDSSLWPDLMMIRRAREADAALKGER